MWFTFCHYIFVSHGVLCPHVHTFGTNEATCQSMCSRLNLSCEFWKAGKVNQLRLGDLRKKTSVGELLMMLLIRNAQCQIFLKSRSASCVGPPTFLFLGLLSVACCLPGIILRRIKFSLGCWSFWIYAQVHWSTNGITFQNMRSRLISAYKFSKVGKVKLEIGERRDL